MASRAVGSEEHRREDAERASREVMGAENRAQEASPQVRGAPGSQAGRGRPRSSGVTSPCAAQLPGVGRLAAALQRSQPCLSPRRPAHARPRLLRPNHARRRPPARMRSRWLPRSTPARCWTRAVCRTTPAWDHTSVGLLLSRASCGHILGGRGGRGRASARCCGRCARPTSLRIRAGGAWGRAAAAETLGEFTSWMLERSDEAHRWVGLAFVARVIWVRHTGAGDPRTRRRPCARTGEDGGGAGGAGRAASEPELEVHLPTAGEWREALPAPHAAHSVPAPSPVITDVDPHSHLAPAVWPGVEAGDWRAEGFESRQQVAWGRQLAHGWCCNMARPSCCRAAFASCCSGAVPAMAAADSRLGHRATQWLSAPPCPTPAMQMTRAFDNRPNASEGWGRYS